jgi:DNA-binding CsgD family transcriptional regulator
VVNVPSRYSHFFKSNSPFEIANSRSAPAIVLLNVKFEVVYINSEALAVLKDTPFAIKKLAKSDNYELPKEVVYYCNEFKKNYDVKSSTSNFPPLVLRDSQKRENFCFRLIQSAPTRNLSKRKYDPYLILLIEKISSPESFIEPFHLSNREKDIVELLFAGSSNKEIASQLFLSEYTVEDHIKNLMKKLHVKNRLSIVLKFLGSQSI